MGIPSYFSYIIKNHPDIIKNLKELGDIDNFYIDSNSIIYDSLRRLANKYNENDSEFEDLLLKDVYVQLNNYIKKINPKKKTYIAFDGVAPVAKLEQQRTRRYKSNLLAHIRESVDPNVNKMWDKTAITPGTAFMDKLGLFLLEKYKKNKKIIISTTNDPGEGEHKIFQYIRNHAEYHNKTMTLIYGLDADLIMLCLNQFTKCKQIYLYRETPEFIKSICSDLEPNSDYFLDIPILGDNIINEMSGFYKSTANCNIIYDYILLTFFLGNDFLPHFPSMNIRTSGMTNLLTAYRNTICKQGVHLTDGKNIYWGNVRKLVGYLADKEEYNLKHEYKIRDKWEKHNTIPTTIEKILDNIPTQQRESEKYIDPFSKHWETRYYEELFETDMNKIFLKQICTNFMEGLEWVMRYYTHGCCDWNWHYKYHYPPLLKDLVDYIPYWDTIMIETNDHLPITPITQLAYVLPRSSLTLLPLDIHTKILKEYSEYYPDDCKIIWAFCKYFWESHVDLPVIDLNVLKTITK